MAARRLTIVFWASVPSAFLKASPVIPTSAAAFASFFGCTSAFSADCTRVPASSAAVPMLMSCVTIAATKFGFSPSCIAALTRLMPSTIWPPVAAAAASRAVIASAMPPSCLIESGPRSWKTCRMFAIARLATSALVPIPMANLSTSFVNSKMSSPAMPRRAASSAALAMSIVPRRISRPSSLIRSPSTSACAADNPETRSMVFISSSNAMAFEIASSRNALPKATADSVSCWNTSSTGSAAWASPPNAAPPVPPTLARLSLSCASRSRSSVSPRDAVSSSLTRSSSSSATVAMNQPLARAGPVWCGGQV